MDKLEEEYNKWLEKQTFEKVDVKELKRELVKELKFLSTMPVEEYTLYRKWQEIQLKYPVKKTKNPFFDVGTVVDKKIEAAKNNIWIPESPEDFLKLEPVVEWTMVGTKKEVTEKTKTWSIIRTYVSSMLNNSNIGRNLRFIVKDGVTGKYLGVIGCSSDFMDLTPRDSYIGWSRDVKTKQKMINHTAIGSSIVPTQPLGFSYVGGKLLALLTISDVTENAWNERYKNVLVGYTTTSLYGSFSQYNGLKYWNKRGHSAGSIKFEPSKKVVLKLRNWLRVNHPRRYWEWYEAKNDQGLPYKRDHKQRSMSFVFRQLKIDKKLYETNHQRGIYFCTLYNNTNEFLRKEITEDKLVRRFDNSVESLTELWKTKYASKRLKSLMKSDRYTSESLFYDDLMGTSWEEVKEKYIKQVGR
jgi:hypothetical protein